MNAVNAIVVPNGKSTTRPLYQWDYGQRLILLGYVLPDSYEVHFSNTEDGTATIQIGDSTGVDIPDTYLATGSDVWAWLYLHTGSADGETKATIRIPVRKRAQPTGGSPTPAQQDTITQAIALLNSAVEETSADAESAHADAERAETAAENLEGVVRYTAQELTAEQQAQARTNIGVPTAVVRYDTAQSLNSTQKTQARTNIGLGDYYTDIGRIGYAERYLYGQQKYKKSTSDIEAAIDNQTIATQVKLIEHKDTYPSHIENAVGKSINDSSIHWMVEWSERWDMSTGQWIEVPGRQTFVLQIPTGCDFVRVPALNNTAFYMTDESKIIVGEFYRGDGYFSTGAYEGFRIPAGATRLYCVINRTSDIAWNKYVFMYFDSLEQNIWNTVQSLIAQ